ncbi:MAG: ATP-binding protein [bacterium]|nr:ATP-binding protein [bacterium]
MNPFVYGERVKEENFCNREDEIKELVSEISSGQNIMIYSPRRYGKTSLIDEVLRKLDKKGLFTIYIDLFPVISNEDFVRISLKSISLLLSKDSKNILKKVKIFFKQISPSLFITVAEDGIPSVGINFSKAEVLPVLEDLFNGLYAFTKDKKKPAVVVFDEFQQVGELEDTRVEKTLRGVIQTHREISYVFMGSKKHLIYEMFIDPGRPFFKSSAHFPLEKIDPVLFSDFVYRKFIKSNRQIEDGAAMYIVNKAEAHPYYTQLLAHTAWESGKASEAVDIEHVDAAVNRILKREEAAFAGIWDNLTLNQKKLLLAMAFKEKNDKIFSSDFLDKYNLNSPGTVQRGIKSLITRGLIDKEENSIEINDVFLKMWLKQRMR